MEFLLFIESLLDKREKRKIRVTGSTLQETDKKDMNFKVLFAYLGENCPIIMKNSRRIEKVKEF